MPAGKVARSPAWTSTGEPPAGAQHPARSLSLHSSLAPLQVNAPGQPPQAMDPLRAEPRALRASCAFPGACPHSHGSPSGVTSTRPFSTKHVSALSYVQGNLLQGTAAVGRRREGRWEWGSGAAEHAPLVHRRVADVAARPSFCWADGAHLPAGSTPEEPRTWPHSPMWASCAHPGWPAGPPPGCAPPRSHSSWRPPPPPAAACTTRRGHAALHSMRVAVSSPGRPAAGRPLIGSR